jgi:mRNA interferase MazF
MRRGELYRVWKPGGAPKRHRVFVVVSRQAVIESQFSTVICAPVFSSGEGLSTQVSVGTDHGLKHQSWIMCDNLVSLRKSELTDYVGSLSSREITELNRSLVLALQLPL